ncbi:MAG: fused MFS/spermidine synthase, partial [Planctomycetes bacterium]|nr:fused MFS/spermidine synthase [Planctomycetota bacterium]
MRALVLAFFFVSGLCGLLYEIVWIRVAGTVIGNTTHAVGTVVGVFMGGLALGGWWGGRQADRRSGGKLLALYAMLEGGVAVAAIAVPLLIAASEPLFRVLWNALAGAPVIYGSLRVLLVGVLLLVPTTLMGATLPVLSRFLSSSIDAAGREAGRAYAINTFGGVIGTLAAGF